MKKKLLVIFLILVIGAIGSAVYFRPKINLQPEVSSKTEKDPYLAFLLEVFETIKGNYWEKISDENLINVYKLGAEKLTGSPQVLKTNNKEGLRSMLGGILKTLGTDDKKKEFSAGLADIILANLQPFGRSRLYSQKEETSLKNTVNNVDPSVNQYDILGLPKEASGSAIKQALENKTQELKSQPETSETKKKLAQLDKTSKILADEGNRKIYDLTGAEPTMDYKLITPNVFYIHIKKFSPTTVEELQRVTEKPGNREGLDSLIIDLRNNIGGAIDGLPYFLGPFIGPNQYAYQFYHQGENIDFKTQSGWLNSMVPYKKVVVLINEGSQSTAEVMAAVLKKYNVGVLVGTPTKGWGTVERVFPLTKQISTSEKYSAFLVHSVTLRDDGQPIEGRGVDPTISIKDPQWEKKLYAYFHYDEFISAVKKALNEKI